MRVRKYVAVTLAIFLMYELLTSLVQTLVFGGVWELGLTHGDLIWSFLFVHFFIKSCPEGDLAAGAQFGLLIGIFFCSPLVFGFSRSGKSAAPRRSFPFGTRLRRFFPASFPRQKRCPGSGLPC